MGKKINKKKLIIIGSILIVFFVILYFLLFFNKNDNSDIRVEYANDNSQVSFNNALPITDIVGKNLSIDNAENNVAGYIEFEVKSLVDNKIKYEITLTKNNDISKIPEKFIKVYLTDDKNNILDNGENSSVTTYYNLKNDKINSTDKIIYNGVLKNKDSKKFKLRMWVADNFQLTNDSLNFSVNLNVNVK